MASPFSRDDARASRDVPDEVLAARVAAQDREAFAELYDRYARRVYLLAAHVLGPARAEDVVQDAFLSLWRRAHRYDSRRSVFAAWFMAVARHRVLDELRRRSLEQRVLAVEPVDQLLAETPDAALGVADAAVLRERDDVLLRALATLPPEQRRAIVLAYFGGLTHVEIAAALGEPLGTVKKRLQLGLRKLHRALAGERPLSAPVRTAERKEA
jgi:RNA polymerase sigma-70 factor (ECF subfamily)